jgi:hypothetical protein
VNAAGSFRLPEETDAMATQSHGDLTFVGRLRVELDDAEEPTYPDGFLLEAHRTGHICFGTTRPPPQGLWLGAPKIRFNGMVATTGPGSHRHWEIGFLQTISWAAWTGHYSNSEQLRFRLNTDNGPLKDGGAESLFFRWTRRLEGTAPNTFEAEIDDSDCPAVMFWREYSGDPFQPHSGPTTRLGRLLRTEGEWRFHTFLAAVNQTAKSIITFAECQWVLAWEGAYDYDSELWNPKAEAMIIHREIDQAGLYENPGAASAPLPFSLYLDTAKQSWEVWASGEWILCRDCRPKPDAADRARFKRWEV